MISAEDLKEQQLAFAKDERDAINKEVVRYIDNSIVPCLMEIVKRKDHKTHSTSHNVDSLSDEVLGKIIENVEEYGYTTELRNDNISGARLLKIIW